MVSGPSRQATDKEAHASPNVWMYVCMYVCLSVCLSVCLYVCMYVCMYWTLISCLIFSFCVDKLWSQVDPTVLGYVLMLCTWWVNTTSHHITRHDMTWHVATNHITSPHVTSQPTTLLHLTPQPTSWHQNRSHHHHGTSPPWNGRRLVHSKKWFGHRAGRSPCAHSIGKFFLWFIVLFPFGNFRPRSPGNYL